MSQAPITLFRAETRTLPPRGECFVGAAAADITPHLALPLAGYSSTGSLAQGVHARLFARAFVLEDAAGQRAAIVVLDMMSASRFLVEKVAARVGPSVGIGVDRLLLCGTHTHHGPGNFYGNTLYDALAQKRPGIDLALCDWLAERISQAITDAVEALVPGSLGYGQTTLFGVSRNASLDAFHTNPEALQWDHPGWPGFGAPSNLTPTQRAIDPRLRALVLLDGQRRLVGALSFFGCHPTTLGKHYDLYSSDWVGFALREARQSGGSFTDGSTLALATTTAGDVNALHAGMAQGLDLARFVGCQVGQGYLFSKPIPNDEFVRLIGTAAA